jgi:hypothetical protein
MKLLEIFNKENAQVDLDQLDELLEKFFSVALSELKLKTLPKFSIHKTVGDPDYPSFGGYDFENNVLYVAIANRHIVDILRTIAHELVHYSQNLNDGLSVDDGITGSEKENQANAVAGVILRKFNKKYPEYLSVKPILVEKWSQKYKRGIDCNNPKGFSQRAHCQGRKKRVKENTENDNHVYRVDGRQIRNFEKKMNTYYHTDDYSQSGRFDNEDTVPKEYTGKMTGLFTGTKLFVAPYVTGNPDTTRYVAKYSPGKPVLYIDAKDVPRIKNHRSWVSAFDAKNFKKLPTGEYFSSNPSNPVEQKEITDPFEYLKSVGWTVEIVDDLHSILDKLKKSNYKYGAEGMQVNENFADGRKPGRKGLAKRVGVNCKASVSSLRKTAKNSTGEKRRMAHWCANMKSGKK